MRLPNPIAWFKAQTRLTKFLLLPCIVSLVLFIIPMIISLIMLVAGGLSFLVGGGPNASVSQGGFATDVAALTNEYRSANGLIDLTYNHQLEAAAHAHALDPASLKGHVSSNGDQAHERVSAAGYSWSVVAENIYISSFDPGAPDAMRGWKESPGHNANLLLDSIREIGIAKHLHDDTWVVVAVYAAAR